MWNSGWTHHSMYGADGNWFGFMGMHGIFMVLLTIFIVGLIFFLFRQNVKLASYDPAILSLGERYAKGEILREEYLEKKKDLRAKK